MKKFEYKIFDFKKIDDLNQLGDEGWELCVYTQIGHKWVFKKEIYTKDISIDLLTSCSLMRNVFTLQHRTIMEFAGFVDDTINGKHPEYEFDWNNRNAIEIWIDKFHQYCMKIYDDKFDDI